MIASIEISYPEASMKPALPETTSLQKNTLPLKTVAHWVASGPVDRYDAKGSHNLHIPFLRMGRW